MGKGKGKRKIRDFNMSVDYGIAHGPLDRINMIRVKEKRIFCGNADHNVVIPIMQPDLFGGDDAEGGVVGDVELYLGTDEQEASPHLAARFGRTPENMPGYRGVAHAFFRGGKINPERARAVELWSKVESGSSSFYDEIELLKLVFTGNLTEVAKGFRWTSNNPYMPAPDVSFTRIPTGLNRDFATIWPIIGVDEEGDYVTSEETMTVTGDATSTDLGALPRTYVAYAPDKATFNLPSGITDDELAEGLFKVQATVSGHARHTFYDTDRDLYLAVRIQWKDADGNDLGQRVQQQNSGTGVATVNAEITAPVGARSYDIWAVFDTTLPFYTTIEWLENTARANYNVAVFKPAHCSINQDASFDSLNYLPDANPAHIIFDCLTNPDWGKQEPEANIDKDSFEAVAETLYNEHFGLSILWVRQTEIENFIQEVLDHIKGFLFQMPGTGKWTLKLLRDDYDAEAAPQLDPSNCTISNPKRRGWGETINEIVASYTDPQTEESASVTWQDQASIAMQGAVVSDPRDYYGVRNEWLALQLAKRDVRESSYPLFSCEVYVDRSEWQITPGSVRRFVWPDEGIASMVLRVMDVDYGKPTDRKIKLYCTEDIFGLEQTALSLPQEPGWVSPRENAEPLDEEFAMAIPAPMVVLNGTSYDALDANYPATGVLLIGENDDKVVIDIEARAPVTKANGDTVVDKVATVLPTASTFLVEAIPAEASSTISDDLVDILFFGDQEVGDLILIGTSEAVHEIVMLDTYDEEAEVWTISRGVWDTVPVEWSEGTRIWNMPDGSVRLDSYERAATEEITYRFLPRMTEGRLYYDEAEDVPYTVSERPHAPFRPANVSVDGNGFEAAEYPDGDAPDPLPLTWANRNRTTEDQVIQKWGSATVTPETGQTTTIRVYEADGTTVAAEFDGLSGTSYSPALAALGTDHGWIEFVSERDGIESLWNARRWFDLRASTFSSTSTLWSDTNTTLSKV